MAIKPICDKCNEELHDFGAILLSPPNRESSVRKFHICKGCFSTMEKEMKKKTRKLSTITKSKWKTR